MKIKYLTLMFLILIPLAYSTQEHDWLADRFSEGSWDNNIQDTSLALLALKDSSYEDEISKGIAWLESKMESCVSLDNCNFKDASFALLALDEVSPSSETVDNLQEWILNNSIFQYEGEKTGWLAQVISDGAGICDLYDTNNPSQKISMAINSGFTPFKPITFISDTTSSISVDCSSLSGNPKAISLMRQSGTTYYVNKEANNQKQVALNLGYSCWGSGTCDADSTAFVLLALKKSGKLSDPKWLENRGSLTALQNAILYYVTNDEDYLDKVLEDQSQFGYWGSANVYDTALIYSLIPDSSARDDAEDWLKEQRDNNEGCWPKPASLCKTRSSAAVLYSGLYGFGSSSTDERIDQFENRSGGDNGISEECPEGFSCITEEGNEGVCDYWGQCIQGAGGIPRSDSGSVTCEEGDVCTEGGCPGVCDAFGDCVDDQTDNCIPDTAVPRGTTTEEKGGSLLFWLLMILLLLIILIGGGYLAYRKGWIEADFLDKYLNKEKKSKKIKSSISPSFQINRHPLLPASQRAPRQHSERKIKDRIGSDLDRSIREMERLLSGRKKK